VLDKICKKGLTVEQTEALVEVRLKQIRKRQLKRKVRGEENGSVRAIKDIRLFLNAIKDVVGQMKATGVKVVTEEVRDDDVLELRIRISKPWNGSKEESPKTRAGLMPANPS
jgi:ParB family chromosome partitioning protein